MILQIATSRQYLGIMGSWDVISLEMNGVISGRGMGDEEEKRRLRQLAWVEVLVANHTDGKSILKIKTRNVLVHSNEEGLITIFGRTYV